MEEERKVEAAKAKPNQREGSIGKYQPLRVSRIFSFDNLKFFFVIHNPIPSKKKKKKKSFVDLRPDSDFLETKMSAADIGGILDNSKELERLRKEQAGVLMEINRMHKKLQSSPELVERPGDTSLSRLKYLYSHAKKLSESEVTISDALLSQLDTLMPSGPSRRKPDGTDPKRKRGKIDPEITRVSASVRNQLENCASLVGEQVAARVTPDDAEKDIWFVVKVIHFDRENKEFEVLDEEPGDEEDGSSQRKYRLPISHIKPFPKRNEPSSASNFSPRTQVLAVYPGTTALYKATVVKKVLYLLKL
ncbi:hypothetical protein SAY87_008628 [Trapa incisa]|uniref:SGF29 C-terminal domain-containing protein n=1 Tax=Trapa incisa TaxID=236973 RepID=A0AAN7JVK9_9MYRT|nr:hypothetical protein SAY87_008628 [Trapa incisa]